MSLYQISLVDIVTNPYFLFSLVFWVIMFLVVKILKKKRASFEFFFPLLFMARTKRFNRLLTRIGQKWPRFWKVFWTIGIFVSFAFLVGGLWYFTTNLFALIINPRIENAVLPLIPGLTIDFLSYMTYLILPILFVVTLHEAGHGVAATADGLELKSTGVLALGAFFPVVFGAFVEPNERAFKNRKFPRMSRLRMVSAGTFVNAIEVGIAFLLVINLVPIISLGYSQRYFSIQHVSTVAEGGFNANNLVAGEVCTAINGTEINLDKYPTQLNDILTNKSNLKCTPGDTLIFSMYQPSSKNTVNRTVVLGPRNFIGITTEKESNSIASIKKVYTYEEGGNNGDEFYRWQSDASNWNITQFNNTALDYANGITVEFLTTLLVVGRPVHIVVDTINGERNLWFNVNYAPNVPGAFFFNSTYLGFSYEYDTTTYTAVKITRVYRNSSEGGVNEGNIPENVMITAVDGIQINYWTNPLVSIINAQIRPVVNQTLTFTTREGKNYFLIAKEIPVTSVYIGLTQADYWIPKNFFSELLGPTFPGWLEVEFNLFLGVALSVCMFNMMPAPIFDGNQVVKEIVDWSVEKRRGTRFQRRKRDGIRMQFNEKNLEYNFPEAEIVNVERVAYESDPQFTFEHGKDFKLLKSWKSDTYDGISFNVTGGKKPVDKENLLVDYVFDYDENQKFKKQIMWTIRIITLALIVANIVISVVKFGNPFQSAI